MDYHENVTNKLAAVQRGISLAPYIVKEPKLIAKLWEHIKVEPRNFPSRGELYMDSDDFARHTFKGNGIQHAMKVLDTPGVKDIIEVEAMVFPCITCSNFVVREARWYERDWHQPKCRTDLIPFAKDQKEFKDPWTDGKFPQITNTKLLSEEIVNSCVLDNCPYCEGTGYVIDKVYKGQKNKGWVTCGSCGGTGKEGALLCGHCEGHGGWYSYDKVDKYSREKVKCAGCSGTGKMLSILTAKMECDSVANWNAYMPNMDAVLPKAVREYAASNNKPGVSTMPVLDSLKNYQLLFQKEAEGRCSVGKSDLISCAPFDSETAECIRNLKKISEKAKAHCLSEKIKVEVSDRFVRFRVKYFDGPAGDRSVGEREGRNYWDKWPSEYCLPDAYWDERNPDYHSYLSIVIWLDLRTGASFVQKPPCGKSYVMDPAMGFYIVLRRLLNIRSGYVTIEGHSGCDSRSTPQCKTQSSNAAARGAVTRTKASIKKVTKSPAVKISNL